MSQDSERFAGRAWRHWTVPEVVDVEGVPTAYRRGGAGETIVSLHGGGGTRTWSPFHAELAKSFDVIAPEHPGFGDTPADERFEGWADYILHYDAFLRTLGLGRVHLVGTSLGSWLAAHLAVTYPDRFSTLTLVTPFGVHAPEDPFVDLFRLSPEEEAERFFNGRAERYVDELAQEGEIDDAVFQYTEMSAATRLVWNPRHERRFDTRLARVTIPALLVAPEDDRLVGTGQAARYAALLPHSTVVTIPGPDGEPSSHGLPIEQPAEVAAAVTEFIARSR